MIDSAKGGDFGLAIVHKLDRFSRNRYDSAYYKRELKKCGVTLMSVLENLDDSPESIILESVLEGHGPQSIKQTKNQNKKDIASLTSGARPSLAE